MSLPLFTGSSERPRVDWSHKREPASGHQNYLLLSVYASPSILSLSPE